MLQVDNVYIVYLAKHVVCLIKDSRRLIKASKSKAMEY